MSTIRYDVDDLADTAEMLSAGVDTARQVKDEAGGLAERVADCGSADLQEATGHFLDRWGYGMGIVAEDADGLGGALRDCAASYLELDAGGVAALQEGG